MRTLCTSGPGADFQFDGRLEHVGDAVLNLALAHISYELYPHIGPAALTVIFLF